MLSSLDPSQIYDLTRLLVTMHYCCNYVLTISDPKVLRLLRVSPYEARIPLSPDLP